MVRALLGSLALVLLAGTATAAEVKGPVTDIDPEKYTITVLVDSKSQIFDVAKDAKITSVAKAKGKKAKPGAETTLTDGLKGIKLGSMVTMNAEKKDDKTVVDAIKVEPPEKKKKKKKTN